MDKNLFLKEKELFIYCIKIGTPLPFSLSSLQKDRLDQRLGGIPYRRKGGIRYLPSEVFACLHSHPVIQGSQNTVAGKSKKRITKPTKEESVSARRAGITVAELRARNGVKNG